MYSFDDFKKIDAHSHIGNFGGWAEVNIDQDAMLDYMGTYNIEKTIIIGTSCLDNKSVLAAYEAKPDKFIPLAWVNPNLGQPSLDEARDLITNHGFYGLKMHPLFDAYVADAPHVDPFIALAEELEVPVFIHCGHPPFSLPWSIALLAERFPNVKIVMIHMGHGHGVYIDASIQMAKRYDNLYLEMSGMPMGSKVREAYETVGPDRIFFGIDSPFHHPTVEIQKVLTSGLEQNALEDVFYNNIAKFLNL